jgi:hypothetical protein
MSAIGIVSMAVGLLIIVSRGLLVLAPAATLRWFGGIIQPEAKTRIFGICALLVAAPMIWAGASETSGLGILLYVFGVFVVIVSLPALVFFPRAYMAIADGFLPTDSNTGLFGWRILGLVGVIIGAALFMAGLRAL